MLEKLTDKQIKLAKDIEHNWLNFFYNLEFDEKLAIECSKYLYNCINHLIPEILVCDSPHECQRIVREKDDSSNSYYEPCHSGTIDDYHWVASYEFFLKIGLINCMEFEEYLKLVKSNIFYLIAMDDICVISRPPVHLRVDENGRMHSTTESAMKYADGFELFFVKGINFSKKLFEFAFLNKMSAKDILNIENVEQRAVVIDHYGIDYIIDQLNAKILDTHEAVSIVTGKNTICRLLEFEISGAPFRAIELEDHSVHKKTILGVEISEKTNTALGAIAWTFGMSAEEYKDALEIEL